MHGGVGEDGAAKTVLHHRLGERHAIHLEPYAQPYAVLDCGLLDDAAVVVREARHDQRHVGEITDAAGTDLRFAAARAFETVRRFDDDHLLVHDDLAVQRFRRRRVVQHRHVEPSVEQPFLQQVADAVADLQRHLRPVALKCAYDG